MYIDLNYYDKKKKTKENRFKKYIHVIGGKTVYSTENRRRRTQCEKRRR